MRRVISKRLNYIPVEWGVRSTGGEIVAFARFRRMDNDYSMYGDDADVYEEFEREGFTLTKKAGDYAEAYDWIKNNVENTIGD